MSVSEREAQPVQGLSPEPEEAYNATENPIPANKSSVGVNKKAPTATPKFEKYDTVHMTVKENGIRKKGTYTVYKIANSSAGYVEYQLQESDGSLFNSGQWVREGELKMDKRG